MRHSLAHSLILAAAVVGVAARLAFGLFYWVDKPLTHDEVEYLTLAGNLAAGRGFTYSSETGSDPRTVRGSDPEGLPHQQFGRAPGYPAFLALIGAGRGNYGQSPPQVKVAQAILGGATVYVIGVLAFDAAGPLAGVIGAGLAAVYPPLVWIPAYVFSESLYSVMALLTAFVLQRSAIAHQRRGWPLAAIAGCLAGLAILIRPAMLFFVPIAAAWLVGRRNLRHMLVFVIAAATIVVPWTVRNALVHGRVVVVASEGGVTFWTGNHPLARGEGDLAANPDLEMADLEFRKAHRGLSAEDLEGLYYRDALRWIASEPLKWFGLVLRKAFFTVVPVGPSYAVHSIKYRTASIVSYLLVLPLAILGLRRTWRDERRPAALLLLAASALLAGLIFFPQERFRIPVIDPALIVCAAVWLSTKWPRS